MKETWILTRKASFGGFTAVFQGTGTMPIEAYLATGKGSSREASIRDLFTLIPVDVLNRELRPFEIRDSNEYHPI